MQGSSQFLAYGWAAACLQAGLDSPTVPARRQAAALQNRIAGLQDIEMRPAWVPPSDSEEVETLAELLKLRGMGAGQLAGVVNQVGMQIPAAKERPATSPRFSPGEESGP